MGKGEGTYGDGRAPADAHATMHEDLPALTSRAFDPFTYRCELGLERVDAVVAYAFDIQHLDPALAFFDVQGSLQTHHTSAPKSTYRDKVEWFT